MEMISKRHLFSHTGVNPYALGATYHFNHGPSIICMANGQLMAAWFSGPWEGHPRQCILCSNSDDHGETWSEAKVFVDTQNAADFDPAFILGENRVFFVHSLARWWEPKLAGEQQGFLGSYVRYTDDNGENWSESVFLHKDHAQRSNGIQMSNKSILFGFYTPENRAGIYKSDDNGQTWRVFGDITGSTHYAEPTVVETERGTILMYLRAKDGFIWEAVSLNWGEHWSPPKRTAIQANNSSHKLFKLQDGRLVLIYNPSEPERRTPLVTRLSVSDSIDWGEPLVIDEIHDSSRSQPPVHPSGTDFAVTYPSVVENARGNLVVVWAKYKISETEHYGDIMCAELSP